MDPIKKKKEYINLLITLLDLNKKVNAKLRN